MLHRKHRGEDLTKQVKTIKMKDDKELKFNLILYLISRLNYSLAKKKKLHLSITQCIPEQSQWWVDKRGLDSYHLQAGIPDKYIDSDLQHQIS